MVTKHIRINIDSVASMQSGAALLVVMLVLVLLTTLATYMIEDEHLALRRTQNYRDLQQNYELVAGSEQWATVILRRDLFESETDHLAEAWMRLLPEVSVDEGKLTATAQDRQGLFNINNLAAGRDKVWYPAFRRLLQMVELDESLADAIVDWIDANQDVSGSAGAESIDYLGLDPPYRAADQNISDIGELLWVAGFDAEKFAKLVPYIAALPEMNVAINVNTCPVPLLRILGSELLDPSAAESLASGRGEEGYDDIAAFLQHPALAGSGDVAQAISAVSSRYFRIISRSEFGRVQLQLQSLLRRFPENGQVVVLRRSRSIT
ncbi:MAG: type II secretion system minor pseudopilin GspK [Gammaproteobacteria bacterium]|nr:type II secretion system minor pseudopilin GspK [Gammaproteobacteria bacterium]MDH3467364.1 type II secretion system minor pseudopilin GspK [Gammaproteobacteria bacterium]